MGLAICRNIAREYGGDLSVDSIVGMGTCFTPALPIKLKQDDPKNEMILHSDEIKELLFTLDKSLVNRYHREACQHKARLMMIDSINKVQQKLRFNVDAPDVYQSSIGQ